MIYFQKPKVGIYKYKVKKEWVEEPKDNYIRSQKRDFILYSPSMTGFCAEATLKSYQEAYPDWEHELLKLKD